MNDNDKSKSVRGTLKGTICVKISREQEANLKTLASHPHYVNIPNYIRDCIDHLYASKIKKKEPSNTNTSTINNITNTVTNEPTKETPKE